MTATNDQRWTLLITVGAALLLITLDNTVLYTALPTLVRDLGATPSQGLWIINAYPLVMAGLLLGTGTLGDRFGHRRMFLGGLVVFGLASLLAAFAPTAAWLIAARALLAVGAAAMMPATLALIRVTFEDERERHMAIAVWGSLAIVGGALGPIVGGLLLQHFWWGSVFLVNVPVVIGTAISAWRVTPRSQPDASRPWDALSSVQVLVALSGLVVAIKELANAAPAPATALSALGLAVAAGVLFLRRQARLPYPLLDVAIFRNRAFMSGVLGAALVTFALGGVQLVTTQRFQLVVDFSPLQSGMLVSAIALGCLPSALLGGAFLHRIGLRPLIAGGLAISALGVVLAAQGVHLHLAWLVTGLVLAGFGLGAVISVASSTIVGHVPAHRAGMASSVEEVSYEFGSLVAVALLGSLLAALAGSGASGGQVLSATAGAAFDAAYRVVMYVVAAFMVVGAGLVFWLLRPQGPDAIAYSLRSH